MSTISGGSGTQITLNSGSNDQNGLATNLANQISAGLASGALKQTDNTNPPTGTAFYVSPDVNTTITMGAAVSALALTGGGAESVRGSGGQDQLILGGSGNLTFFSNGGSGTVVTGDGNNLLGTPTSGGGAFTFVAGAGDDTVVAASGDNTISAGTGANLIDTGIGNNLVYSNGNDTIAGGAGRGTDTVQGGAGSALIAPGSRDLLFPTGVTQLRNEVPCPSL